MNSLFGPSKADLDFFALSQKLRALESANRKKIDGQLKDLQKRAEKLSPKNQKKFFSFFNLTKKIEL